MKKKRKQLDLDYVDKHFVPIERYYQLEKEIEELKQEKEYLNCIIESDNDNYINKDKIKAKIKELENMYNKLPINPKEHLHTKTECKIVIGELQSLLQEEENNEC